MSSSAAKPGRNDRCHCGSGKKYKHCHLDEDQRTEPKAKWMEAPPESFDELDYQNLPGFLTRLQQTAPLAESEELAKILRQSETLLEYLQREEEIDAACLALDPYCAEFETLLANQEDYVRRAKALFNEERFAPLRFTAAEVKQALESVGYIPTNPMSEESATKLDEALLSFATEERRIDLAMKLNLHLPDLVAAGRYMDGWIIQDGGASFFL